MTAIYRYAVDVLTSVDEARDRALNGRDEFFWADLESPSDDDLTAIGAALGLHGLAMEDTREFGQPPKLDHFGDHVLLVFYTARPRPDTRSYEPLEIHVYVSGGFVLTVRRAPCPALDRLRERLATTTPDGDEAVLYRVLDTLADELPAATDGIEEQLDALEGDVLERVRREHATRIYRLKQSVRDLHRVVAHQRDRFHGDAEEILALPGFQPGQRRYLDDVRDTLEQAAAELGRQADDLQALTSTYFNANAERLNSGVARLTVVATFFVVWTLVTSFFGQNFGWLVGSIDSLADFLIWGVGGLVASTAVAGAILWWRRRDLF